jgi:hypothetical protein
VILADPGKGYQMTMRSPNDMMKAAKDLMLNGAEPSSRRDWQAIFNFLAGNIAPEVQPSALHLIAMIYDAPLTKEEINEISAFQIKDRNK